MRKILVPIDGSAESRRAAERAVSIAKTHGGEVTLLCVIEVESDAAFTELGIVISGEYAGVRDALVRIKEETSRKMLDAIAEGFEGSGVPISKVVKTGNAHPEIVEMAKKGGYDLIVMGHRGLNPIKRFFMGSVAKRVIEDAPCSVLIVKEKA